MYKKMTATIIGITQDGQDFTEEVEFTMVPPKEGELHYGTGYYMTAKTPYQTHLLDVRYEKTTDVEILADRWIKNWYGPNAKDVIKQFPALQPDMVPMPGVEGLAALKAQYGKRGVKK